MLRRTGMSTRGSNTAQIGVDDPQSLDEVIADKGSHCNQTMVDLEAARTVGTRTCPGTAHQRSSTAAASERVKNATATARKSTARMPDQTNGSTGREPAPITLQRNTSTGADNGLT